MNRRYVVGNAVIRLFHTPAFAHMYTVAWGECDLLDAIAREAELPPTHALDRHKRVLDALERDPRFEKFLFRVWLGNREGNARAFRYCSQKDL